MSRCGSIPELTGDSVVRIDVGLDDRDVSRLWDGAQRLEMPEADIAATDEENLLHWRA
jgi:hypothetical protein